MYLFHGMKLITEEAIEFRNLVFLMLPFLGISGQNRRLQKHSQGIDEGDFHAP